MSELSTNEIIERKLRHERLGRMAANRMLKERSFSNGSGWCDGEEYDTDNHEEINEDSD